MPTCQHCGQDIEFRYVNGRCVPIHPGGGWHCGSFAESSSGSGGQHVYQPRTWQYSDFTHRTNCPECHKPVYFIRHNDGSVWLDELGWPWPKHACFDQPHTPTSAFHDWSMEAAKNRNPNLGVVTCIRPSLSGASHFTEVTLGNSHKIGFFLAWMPPLDSLLGALVVIAREDHLLIHPVHGEIAMHDIVELTSKRSVRKLKIQRPVKKLEDAGLDVLDYDKDWGRYRIRLTKADLKKHTDLLTEILQQTQING